MVELRRTATCRVPTHQKLVHYVSGPTSSGRAQHLCLNVAPLTRLLIHVLERRACMYTPAPPQLEGEVSSRSLREFEIPLRYPTTSKEEGLHVSLPILLVMTPAELSLYLVHVQREDIR